METARHRWPLNVTRRVRITGRLRMQSALHVGSGTGAASLTDRGVVRHADGQPFIPGSSLKGVLRSHLERLAPALPRVQSCGLYIGRDPVCPTLRFSKSEKPTDATEADLEQLCHTCTLFGSTILAGKVRVPDLEVDPGTYAATVEIRDGVGIDRDSGRAVPDIKYDYEVVPSGTVFMFELGADSPDDQELGLLALAVRELEHGFVSVGGKTSRGLGTCVLGDVRVYYTDFSADLDVLKEHLKQGPTPFEDGKAFLDKWVEALFS